MTLPPRPYTVDVRTRARASVGRQALRREVNDRAAAASSADGRPTLPVLCECGLPPCEHRFAVDVETYADVRRFPTRFVVARGHTGGEERVVDDHGGFLVVERFGLSGLAAVRSDRRRGAAEAH